MNTPGKMKVRFSDKINYSASKIYVPEIHLVLEFDGMLDEKRLHRALRLLLDAEPVLGSRFVYHWRKPYWQRLSEERLSKAILVETYENDSAEDREKAAQGFFGKLIDGSKGPQILAFLLRNGQRDGMILKINHVTCDAGGFKALFYKLASIYSKLGDNPQYTPKPSTGTRSLKQVYGRFSMLQILDILRSGLGQIRDTSVPLLSRQYPCGNESLDRLFYVVRHFSSQRVSRLVAYARKRNATINDLFVTAVLRTLAGYTEPDRKKALRLWGTVDLRRHIPNRRAGSLCQLSGGYMVSLDSSPEKTFEENLFEVKGKIDSLKSDYFGLGQFLIIRLMTAPYPFFLFKKVIEKSMNNIPPGMTNLGLIHKNASNFGSINLNTAYMAVPPIKQPFFGVGLSGFDGTMTLSAVVYPPAAISPEQMEDFFRSVDRDLP